MNLAARLALLSLLLTAVVAQRSSRTRSDRPQGRTLGLLTPLLLGLGGGGGSLFDVPVAPVAPQRPVGGAAAGAQSDQYYGSSYPSYSYRPSYNPYGYTSSYPGYGYGYGYPGLGLGYGSNYYRPSYNYGGYQRPQPYTGNYYGYRPTYSAGGGAVGGGYPSYASYGSTAGVSATPASSALGVGAGGGAGAGAGSPQLSTEQTAQLAGLLGQALGSSLRPYLANGGAAGGGGAAAAGLGGANPQALSGLLGLLG
ncbi:prisilkin-39 [Drosophila subobscura]|uniref:prisilkin-39 n=1 Tax=Drosophila subobscura TaxID=7241 RepID=UPI00155B2047|nr:prisilkin-39 [Drosophila subobscura]